MNGKTNKSQEKWMIIKQINLVKNEWIKMKRKKRYNVENYKSYEEHQWKKLKRNKQCLEYQQ